MLFAPLMQWLSTQFRKIFELDRNVQTKLDLILQNQENQMALDVKLQASVDRLTTAFTNEVSAVQDFITNNKKEDGSLSAADVTALEGTLDGISGKVEAETAAVKGSASTPVDPSTPPVTGAVPTA